MAKLKLRREKPLCLRAQTTCRERTYKKGDALMEAMNVAHFSVNNGPEPVRLLAVYMGAKDVVPVK